MSKDTFVRDTWIDVAAKVTNRCYNKVMSAPDSLQRSPAPDRFATTRWSVVLAAGQPDSPQAAAALEELCRAYWLPVYLYVRQQVGDAHESQDLTQAFFARLLQKQAIAVADPQRGRFREFLLTACRHFLSNEWQTLRAQKRGGGQRVLSLDFDSGESRFAIAAVDRQTPERLYERQWAVTLLERVLAALCSEFESKGKRAQFEVLKVHLTGRNAAESYAQAAAQLGMSEGAVKVAVHRLRSRYRAVLRAEIGETVSGPEEVEDEIRRLFLVLGT